MSNTIALSFCAEDRARLDRLAEALEALQPPTVTFTPPSDIPEVDLDQVQQKLAETLAKASDPIETPKNAADEAEALTPPSIQPEEEKPTQEESEAPTVTLEQIQQKVVQLAAADSGAKKVKVREIVNAYAKKVSDLPEDKWTEVWEKLNALETESK